MQCLFPSLILLFEWQIKQLRKAKDVNLRAGLRDLDHLIPRLRPGSNLKYCQTTHVFTIIVTTKLLKPCNIEIYFDQPQD